MEKESLIQGLKERLGSNASVVSDRSYDEIASAAMPAFADDAKVTDDTWKLPVSMLTSLVGQYRHDVADGITKGRAQWVAENEATNKRLVDEQVATFKAQWEKDHPIPAPSVPEAPRLTGEEKRTAEMKELFKSILAENNKQLLSEDGPIGQLSKSVAGFKETYDRQQRDVRLAGIKKEVTEYLNGLGATSAPAVNLAVKQLEIGEDADIDALKLAAKKSYEEINKEFFGDGAKPYGGSGSGGNGGADTQLREYLQGKQKQAQKEAQDAENLRKKFV